MLLKQLTVAAASLLAVPAAQAFLIPPEVSDADIQVANTIEGASTQVAESQVVNVECPDCPLLVKGKHGRLFRLKHAPPSHLELTFSIDHQPDHDRLVVNGFELYPTAHPSRETLMAPQVIERKEEEEKKKHHKEHDHGERKHHDDHKHHKRPHRIEPLPQRLGFAARVGTPTKDADGHFELVEIELQIIELGVTFIEGIPNVKVKLIQDGQGRLLMSQIEKSEPKQLVELPEGGAEKCKTALCRWIANAREKLKGFKGFGCHGMKPAVAGEVEHHHPHHPPHSPWSAPYKEHRWGKLFKHIGSHILLPVLIGIVAGVSISLIGMAVGTVIVTLWRAVFRRRSGHRRRHSHGRHHKAAPKEAAVEDEKSGLMEDQDLPPSYEEEETVKTAQV